MLEQAADQPLHHFGFDGRALCPMVQDAVGYAIDHPVTDLVQEAGALRRGERSRKVLLQLLLQLFGTFLRRIGGRAGAKPRLKSPDHQAGLFRRLLDV